jgi:histidinol phosphatase-like enzyme (inositol monophosphatase family)
MTSGEGSGPVDLGRVESLVTPLMHKAGQIALRSFRTALVAEDKGGAAGYDPVTAADRMTEAYLRRELSALFPGVEIIGEEGGTTGSPGRLRWVIDPIDGTKAYVTGVPLWGVLLGLVVDGRPVAGWCRQPYLGETFAAVAGTGWLEHAGTRRTLETRSTTDLSVATMYSTHPSMFATPWERAAFDALAARVRLQRFGGDCYSYCMLALGQVDLVVEANMQPYDIVPLIPIVEAAGGVVTGPDGELPLDGGFVVAAATPQLHEEVLQRLAAFRGPRSPKEEMP